eukprot:7386697-Prymnesium_polylepis.2
MSRSALSATSQPDSRTSRSRASGQSTRCPTSGGIAHPPRRSAPPCEQDTECETSPMSGMAEGGSSKGTALTTEPSSLAPGLRGWSGSCKSQKSRANCLGRCRGTAGAAAVKAVVVARVAAVRVVAAKAAARA